MDRHSSRLLSGDIGEAVATALDAAGGKNLEILGADVASQCLQRGLVDEILVYVLPVLLGDGIRFSSPGLARTDLEPLSSPGGRPALVHDGPGQPQPAELAQGCVTVSHEDLLGRRGCLAAPHQTRRSSSDQHLTHPCTNLPGQYT